MYGTTTHFFYRTASLKIHYSYSQPWFFFFKVASATAVKTDCRKCTPCSLAVCVSETSWTFLDSKLPGMKFSCKSALECVYVVYTFFLFVTIWIH